ncbi:MAG: DUF4911 domain-containing protein [Deltaproteobacteria bacterium]|nr:DUF4911 domain-containing protein [Deltaproteobacteria bacterium]
MPTGPDMICFTVRLPRAQIGYLRFLLEAYEGLAQLKAMAGRDEAEVLVPSEREAEASALLHALKDELGLEVVSKTDHPA